MTRLEDELRFEAESYRKEMVARQARIERLKAALREIATRAYETGYELQALARTALKENE